jgi:hypothetical protein
MSDKKGKKTISPESISEVKEVGVVEQRPKGIWGEIIMGILTKTPESMSIFEIFRMTREMYLAQKETAKQQLKIRYCLYSILSIMIITSAILLGVFYFALSMTAIGLSFVGPLITGILGLIVVLASGRK